MLEFVKLNDCFIVGKNEQGKTIAVIDIDGVVDIWNINNKATPDELRQIADKLEELNSK